MQSQCFCSVQKMEKWSFYRLKIVTIRLNDLIKAAYAYIHKIGIPHCIHYLHWAHTKENWNNIIISCIWCVLWEAFTYSWWMTFPIRYTEHMLCYNISRKIANHITHIYSYMQTSSPRFYGQSLNDINSTQVYWVSFYSIIFESL
jgi:hypothetical protein